jgi:hypothetical protein
VTGEAVRDYKHHWTALHLDFLAKNIDEAVKKYFS